jgi:hypothetical protein
MRKYSSNEEAIIANARRILTNQITLPFGAMRMYRLQSDLKEPFPVDLTVFKTFLNTISSYPIGTERLLWNIDALKQQERDIDRAIMDYRDLIFDKCFEIIQLIKNT